VNPQTTLPRYSLREEIAHSVISAVGVALAVAGSAILIARANTYGTARYILSCSVYGATLILLYAASTLFHSIHFPRAKAILRALDHSANFLLIDGTYTPFTLVNLRGPWAGLYWERSGG